MKLDANTSTNTTWQKNLASRPNEIAESGSMRAALFHRLASKVSNAFTFLLSKIDRNRNLTLFGSLEPNGELYKIWLRLFDQFASSLQGSGYFMKLERYDVPSDAKGISFRCKFPFSFLFCSVVEGLRREIPANDFDPCSTLFYLARTAMPLLDALELSEYELELYLQDLLVMQSTDASQVIPWRISHLVLLQSISHSNTTNENNHPQTLVYESSSTLSQSKKKLSKMKKLQNICNIHIALWKNEKVLQQLSSVLSTMPDLREEILRIVQHFDDENSAHNISLLVAQSIIARSRPCEISWETHEKRLEWMKDFEKILPCVENLLDQNSLFEWKALLFLRDFVYETSHLFSTSGDCFSFAELILTNCEQLRVPRVLENVLGFLRKLCDNDNDGTVTKGCSTVAELYFKDFFFRKTHQVANDTITDFELEKILNHAIELILNIHPSFNSSQKLQASKSLQIFILHQFLDDFDLRKKFCSTLTSNETFKKLSLEAEACILFAQVSEDLIWENLLRKPLHIQFVSVLNSLDSITPSSFTTLNSDKIVFLNAIAIARVSLVLLSKLVESEIDMDDKIIEQFVGKMNSLFSKADESRNLKIFFMKTLAKSKGISFVQDFLLCPVRNKMFPWISKWCEQQYIRQFLDSKNNFRVDFFSDIPGYARMVQSIRLALEGTFASLFDLLTDTKKHQSFVFALFSEVFVQYSFPDVSAETKEFINVINTPEHLEKFDSALVPLIKLLLTNKTPQTIINSNQSAQNEFFTISVATTTSDIQLYSVLVRFYVLQCSGTFGIFSQLLKNPGNFVNQFIPSIPSDLLEILAKTLSNATKWYECPNGHAYFIDACGRPMEQGKCNTCGAPIGGQNHNLINSNRERNMKSKSEMGYFIQWNGPNNFDSSISERSLSPLAFRIVRFFIHLVICLRITFIQNIDKDQKLKEFVAPSKIPPGSLYQAFVSRLKYDWNQLPGQTNVSNEETSIVIHLFISKMLNSCDSLPTKIPSEEERETWEKMFSQRFIHELTTGNHLRELIQSYYDKMNQRETFESELQESLNLEVLSDATRVQRKVILWRHRTIISLDLLRHQFYANNENKTKHPVLHLFIEKEKKLKSLQYLRAAIEWQNILSLHYDRQLTREDARIRTVREILRELPNDVKWTWEGYKNAWNSYWPYVERFQCTPIPPMYRRLRLTDDEKIVFSLANETDEGICPFALIQNLIELHNDFLGELRDEDDSVGYLKSHLLTDSHMIAFDMETDLAPLLCIQSVQSLLYRGGNDISFLWDRIERQIIDCVLLGKPRIQTQIKNFQFANEMKSSVLDVLKRFIPQEEIVTLYKEKILSELGSLQAVRLLRDDVDVAIGFLSATCKSFHQIDDKMMLVNYMKNVMRLSPDSVHVFGSNQQSTLSQVVQLHHIISLRSLLNEKLNNNSFDQVEDRFKQKLSIEQKEDLYHMKSKFSPQELEILLSTWKEFIFQRLCGGGYDTFEATHSLKIYLANEQASIHGLNCILEDLSWFNSQFTLETLTLAYSVDAFVFLSNNS